MGQRILFGLTSLMGVEEELCHLNLDGNKNQLKLGFETIQSWISLLTNAQSCIPRIDSNLASDVSSSPLQRCIAREVLKGINIITSVLEDLYLVR